MGRKRALTRRRPLDPLEGESLRGLATLMGSAAPSATRQRSRDATWADIDDREALEAEATDPLHRRVAEAAGPSNVRLGW